MNYLSIHGMKHPFYVMKIIYNQIYTKFFMQFAFQGILRDNHSKNEGALFHG